MGRIHILSDQVANQIAAGEVVERPASVVKELLENSLDAGSTRIRIEVEAGGRKLIRILDNGHGMNRDDALLAFERHATSKLRSSEDLLSIATLGFRGEALPSIASVARVELETRAADSEVTIGTRIQIAGGNILSVEEAGLPVGTTLAIKDLFFNTPARRKFLKSESTELAHIAALVTHYALAHHTRHFELHSQTQALLIAPAVSSSQDRLFQIFGHETAALMLPTTAELDFTRAGLPEPPPWKRESDYEAPDPGFLRITGFVSKPELQKLNRNSVYVFVNHRLIRDRLVLHALTEAYRNIIPPTSFPVVLLFLEMPPQEVDVNVHPAKTEVRFRQPAFVHDFIRDTVRTTLMQARPAASFAQALDGVPFSDASSSLLLGISPLPGAPSDPVFDPRRAPETFAGSEPDPTHEDAAPFTLAPRPVPESPGRLAFSEAPLAIGYEDHTPPQQTAPEPILYGSDRVIENPSPSTPSPPSSPSARSATPSSSPSTTRASGSSISTSPTSASSSKRSSANARPSRSSASASSCPSSSTSSPPRWSPSPASPPSSNATALKPSPSAPAPSPSRPRPSASKAASSNRCSKTSFPLKTRAGQTENAETRARRIAASMACHAAVKINMPLDPAKIDWLLTELGKTEHPTSCPHGRPIALRYSHREIEKAFQRT